MNRLLMSAGLRNGCAIAIKISARIPRWHRCSRANAAEVVQA